MKTKPFTIGDLVVCEGSDIHDILGVIENYDGLNFNLKVTQASADAPNHKVGAMLEVGVHEIRHFYSDSSTTQINTSSTAMKVLVMTGVQG